MSEPTSILTFEDLITRVAREAGIAYYGSAGSEKAMPPIDVHDLELCKEIVNDGIRQFITDAPRTGWRWRRRIMSVDITGTRITGTVDGATAATLYDATLFETYITDNGALVDMYIYILTGTGAGSWAKILNYDATSVPGTIGIVGNWLDQYGNAGGTTPVAGDTYAITGIETVGGDIARYSLVENFGGEVSGPIEYEKDSSHSAIIEWRDESFIRARRATTVQSGYPRYAAIRPLEPTSNAIDPKRRYELILDPEPNTTEVLEFPYILTFNKLDMETGLADTPNDATVELLDATRTEGNDYFNDWKITIISGTGKGSYAIVTDYVGSTGQFVVADWLTSAGVGGGTDPDANSVYKVEPAANLHPAGFRFDQAILAACLAQAELMVEDVASNFVSKYEKKDLMIAHQADARNAPRKLGSMNTRKREHRHRYRDDVTYD